MLLDLRSLWEGPPAAAPPPPPAPVVTIAETGGGAAWIGSATSEIIRAGEQADEELVEVLLMARSNRRRR